LTAILLHRGYLRMSEFGDGPRAGFCLMGACQDCWVSAADGERLRACTTYVAAGMAIVTAPEGGTTADSSTASDGGTASEGSAGLETATALETGS
jgi:hypothetical protein